MKVHIEEIIFLSLYTTLFPSNLPARPLRPHGQQLIQRTSLIPFSMTDCREIFKIQVKKTVANNTITVRNDTIFESANQKIHLTLFFRPYYSRKLRKCNSELTLDLQRPGRIIDPSHVLVASSARPCAKWCMKLHLP